eukprot:gene11172-biopygen21374
MCSMYWTGPGIRNSPVMEVGPTYKQGGGGLSRCLWLENLGLCGCPRPGPPPRGSIAHKVLAGWGCGVGRAPPSAGGAAPGTVGRHLQLEVQRPGRSGATFSWRCSARDCQAPPSAGGAAPGTGRRHLQLEGQRPGRAGATFSWRGSARDGQAPPSAGGAAPGTVGRHLQLEGQRPGRSGATFSWRGSARLLKHTAAAVRSRWDSCTVLRTKANWDVQDNNFRAGESRRGPTAQGVSGGTDRHRRPLRGSESLPHHPAPRVPLDPPVQDAAGHLQHVLSPRHRDRGGEQAAQAGTGRLGGGAAAGAARRPPAAV